jgi:hypothetical protein
VVDSDVGRVDNVQEDAMVDDTIEDAGRSSAGNAVLGGEQLIAPLGAGQEDVFLFFVEIYMFIYKLTIFVPLKDK